VHGAPSGAEYIGAVRRDVPPALLEALGITRLARVTGLDRTGVEVFAAVRPTGHVLQVTQGKGMDRAAAAWSAVGEAAELDAAERPEPTRLVFAAGSDLEGLVLDDDGLRRAWVRGRRASDQVPVWVAAERVYCPPAGRVWLGPSTRSWSSNGLGAHRLRRLAQRHAVLEVWERHALSRALPYGWRAADVRTRRVAWRSPLVTKVEAKGFVVVACVLEMRPVPLAGVLLFEPESTDVPLTAGYACRGSVGDALEAALLEAAQSRLTEIHGAREDVAVGHREAGRALLSSAQRSRAARLSRSRVREVPRAVLERVVLVELCARPLVVVKAVGIDLDESELLR
jgi:YcaO-like protein with predicted kinase domain